MSYYGSPYEAQCKKAQAAAHAYTAQGFTIVRSNGKKPLDKWGNAEPLTPDQLARWDAPNLQIVTGSKSRNLFIVDCDSQERYAALCAALPGIVDTHTVTSGSGKGRHLYFTADFVPDSIEVLSINGVKGDNLEIKADRRLVVAPPSIHPKTGKPYTVSIDAPIKHLTLDELQQLVNHARSLQPEKEQRRSTHQPATGNKEIPADLINAIAAAAPVQKWKSNGCSEKFTAPNRPDNDPSFDVNRLTGWGYDWGQRKWYHPHRVAEMFGIDWRRFTPTKPERRTSAHRQPAPVILQNPATNQPGPETAAPKLLPPARARLEPFTPHVRQSAPYVNDLPYIRGIMTGADLPAVMVLKSATGTGKTQFVVDLLKARPFKRVLYLTHSETLTVNATERLKTTERDFLRYGDLPPDVPLYMADSVVCSLDSLYRLAGASMPYDLVIFDESVQSFPHFTSKTMNDRYTANWQTISAIFKNAGHIIAMDAQQSDLAAHWTERLTGRAALKVENAHRQPNTLTLHTDYTHLRAALTEAVDANQGTVIFTTSSRSEARQMKRYFERRLPAGQVRAIHGWNSQTADSRQFVQNFNEELLKLRLFIASPSVATGVDVTAPVYAVFGSFGSPTAPNHWLQQLRRYRRAAQYHATIRAGNSESLITDPEALLSMERGKALATRDLARFNDYNVPVATTAQAEITRLWADFTAATNRQKVQPEAYFVALAQHEGFTVYEDDRTAPAATRAAFKANRDALKAEDDSRTLSLEPVSSRDLDKRRRTGTADEADMLAHLRWKIEDTTGATITPELLDRYRTSANRAALRRFTDYTEHVKVDQGKDRTEAALLPFKRGHHTLHRTILDNVIQAVWGSAGLDSTEVITAPELEKRLKPVIREHERSIQQLDRRSDLSEEVIPVLRRVLAWFGLTISSKQVRAENGRVMVYWLDRDNLATIQAAAERRRAHVAAHQHDLNVSKITVTDSYKRDFRQPSPVPDAPPPKPTAPPRLALLAGAGLPDSRPLNPFGGLHA